MHIRPVLFQLLEYTPLGFISGIMHLRALDEKNTKAHKIAQDYLGVQRNDSSYSQKNEKFRGILSCIPIANMALIPIDIAGFCNVKIFNNKSSSKQKNFENVKNSLNILEKYYDEFEHLKNSGKSNGRGYLIGHYPNWKEPTKEIVTAFDTINKSLKKYYPKNEEKYSEMYDMYTKTSDVSEEFDIETMAAAFEKIYSLNDVSKQKHAFYFIECPSDTHAREAALYIRKHRHSLLNFVNQELQGLQK